MNTEWSLDILYKGLDDPAYEADVKVMKERLESLRELVKKAPELPEREMAEQLLKGMEQFMEILRQKLL